MMDMLTVITTVAEHKIRLYNYKRKLLQFHKHQRKSLIQVRIVNHFPQTPLNGNNYYVCNDLKISIALLAYQQ